MNYPHFAGYEKSCYVGSRAVLASTTLRRGAARSCRKVPKELSIRPLFDLVERSLDSQTRLIAPIGDLDAATNPAFRDAVQTASAAERLVLDLSQVSFLSAGAIGVIARARTRIERGHGQLFVICPSPRLRRLFDIAGLGDTLDIYASEEALPA